MNKRQKKALRKKIKMDNIAKSKCCPDCGGSMRVKRIDQQWQFICKADPFHKKIKYKRYGGNISGDALDHRVPGSYGSKTGG